MEINWINRSLYTYITMKLYKDFHWSLFFGGKLSKKRTFYLKDKFSANWLWPNHFICLMLCFSFCQLVFNFLDWHVEWLKSSWSDWCRLWKRSNIFAEYITPQTNVILGIYNFVNIYIYRPHHRISRQNKGYRKGPRSQPGSQNISQQNKR